MIVIVDYGMGNLRAIQNMIHHIGAEAEISSDLKIIAAADRLILPGVGAFDNAIRNIDAMGLRPVLGERVLGAGTPLLGICLGMQLLGEKSEEGTLEGLGYIPGRCIRFDFNGSHEGLKVPHMGWNTMAVSNGNGLFADMPDEPRFYFVHSYHFVCDEESDVICRTEYGYSFASGIVRGNIAGVQFHPEKSHSFGMKLLANFAGVGCYA